MRVPVPSAFVPCMFVVCALMFEAGDVEGSEADVTPASGLVEPLTENPSMARAYACPAVEKKIVLVSSPTYVRIDVAEISV